MENSYEFIIDLRYYNFYVYVWFNIQNFIGEVSKQTD